MRRSVGVHCSHARIGNYYNQKLNGSSWFLVASYQVIFGKQKYQKVSKHKRKRVWFTTFLQCEKKPL